MIQLRSILTVADNSGAKVAKIVGIPGASKRRYAYIGDIVVVAVQKALPNTSLKRHEVHKAVIVRTTKELSRKDGSKIRFDENAVAIINKENREPKGTRVFGPVARELKDRGFNKLISLAPEVL